MNGLVRQRGRQVRLANEADLAALAQASDRELVAHFTDPYYYRMGAVVVSLAVVGAFAMSLGPLYGYNDPEFSVVEQAIAGPFCGLLSCVAGMLGGLLVCTGPFSWLARRRIAKLERIHDWRPREGARHPKGRLDTQDRFVIERERVQTGLRLVLARFAYDGKRWHRAEWPGEAATIALFAPGEEDALLAHEELLRETVPTRERETAEAAVVDAALAAEAAEAKALAATELADWQRRAGGELAV